MCCNHHRTLGHFGACRPFETAIWERRRGPWSMRSHLISNPSARVLKKCERAQLPDVCQHDVYICPEEWQPVAGAQQIPCRPLVALLWRPPLPSLGYDMPMQCMRWVQAHKASFNGRPINAAPAPFRPARLSVRVRAEDVKEKAEKAGEKVQEKAGQAVSKATGKVRHCL